MSNIRVGIDIGGSGIKGALVDIDKGVIVSERLRIETPHPATPDAVASAFRELVFKFEYEGPLGAGFPGVVRDGVVCSGGNIDPAWFGLNSQVILSRAAGANVVVVNDADAAALYESRFGAATDVAGLVIVLTFGTGIGSGFLYNGQLVPNLEMGAIELDGNSPAELFFAASARKREGLSWAEWGLRANRYLTHINRICTPDLLVVGGGIVRKWERWADQIDKELPVVPSQAQNNAGILGAATLVG